MSLRSGKLPFLGSEDEFFLPYDNIKLSPHWSLRASEWDDFHLVTCSIVSRLARRPTSKVIVALSKAMRYHVMMSIDDKRDPNRPDPNKPDPNKPDPNKPDPNKRDPNK